MVNEIEPNNSYKDADEISFNQENIGKLINSSDVDFYKFYVDEAMKISFEFTENSPNTNHRWDARILSDIVLYDSESNSRGRFVINSEEFMFNEHTGGAGKGFNAYFDKPGWYYIQIRQASNNNHSDSDYSFVLKSTKGTFYNEYEYNDTLFTANVIPTKQLIFGNLYEAEKTQGYDIDYYKFSLPSNHDKITIEFSTNGADETSTDSWNVEIFDSLTIAKLDGKEFFDSGQLSVSTKSTGDFYIKISQSNETVNLDSGFYKFTVVTYSGVSPTPSVSGSDNDEASSDNFGATDANDPNIVLTSGNDEFIITKGLDTIDAGLGTDTIILSSRASADFIIRAIDKNSYYTGIANQKFVYIALKDDDNYTVAYNFEQIKLGSANYNIDSFNGKGYFTMSNYRQIPDQDLTNFTGTEKSINLEYYMYSINQGATYIYEITSNINENIKDQIKIENGNLILTPGTGESYTETITIKGQETDRDEGSKTQDVVITLGDNKAESSTDKSTSIDYSDKDKSFFIDKFFEDYYGLKWNWGKEVVTVTYSFPESSLRSTSNDLSTELTREFTSSEREVITSAINLWDNELQTLEFKYIENDKLADLTFGLTFIDGTDEGSLFGLWEGFWDTDTKTFSNTIIRFEDGDLEYVPLKQAALHEIGNILGLGDINPSSDFQSVMEDPAQDGDYSDDFVLSDFDKSMIKIYYDENSKDENSKDDILVLLNSSTYRGLAGDDIYIISNDIAANAKISIVDTSGSNKIQLVDGLGIASSKFAANDIQLTLTNGAVVTINGASNFTYELGGNATSGITGSSNTFSAFAELMGVATLPTSGNSDGSSDISISNNGVSSSAAPTFTLTKSASKVAEGGEVTFTITASSAVSSDTTFSWSAMGDTNGSTVNAASNSDIAVLSGTATIASGTTTTTFAVGAVSDSTVEGLEGVKVNVFDSDAGSVDSSIFLIENIFSKSTYTLSSENNENGPNLNEYSKTYASSGTFNATESNEIIILTGQAKNIRGLEGDDTYVISDLITADAKIQITDTLGNNTIQIPDNTKITKVLFTSNAARLWLKNNQEITINSADKHNYNVSGNSAGGDKGENFTYNDFVDLFNTSIGSGTNTVNLFTKSNASAASKYNIIEVSTNTDKSISGTTDADDFRYEITSTGISKEGPFTTTITNFDKSSDKLTLVTDGDKSLTTQEFDQLSGVEVTSDGISGTQIFFAVDSNGKSGMIVLPDVQESFSNYWTVETYIVEIIPKTNLVSTSNEDDLGYTFSETIDSNKPILSPFNISSISGTVNFINQSEIIIITGQGKNIRGLSGDDTYLVSELIPENSKISITDTEGNNTIQIPDNTYIDASLFTKNAARITLSNNKQITINSADKFTYKIGSNITTGVEGENLTFAEFASAFGIDDILNSTGSVTGTISDQYII